ncbi:MAG: Tol-Pal system beta propeller repeat protein TolB [Deltaproteobacteria bacterium]|nr:Tol-Pal system beta propeller repeat protein TolB [Deltaproteobacteria bacterium]MBN2686645.1 Tol-Pal system beta propeller repeat protein TolB [Deltaproteobacteria bacterium]
MRTIRILIILAFLLSGNTALGKMYIDIDSPAFQQFPMAIPDFKNIDGSDEKTVMSGELPKILSSKLSLTGYFRIIDKKAYIEDQEMAGITAETTDFADWSAIGAEFLVKGGYAETPEGISIELRLFDVVEGKLITGKKYWGTRNELNAVAIKFVDEILLALTGTPGVFDTKIAFTGKKGKISDIYVVNFDGSGIETVTKTKAITVLPHWSTDGATLSFTSYMKANPDLYLLDMPTRKMARLSHYKGLNLSGPWSPDGKKLLLTLSKDGNEEIYVMDNSDRKLTRLTRDPAIDVSPSWSPDGSQIAFVSNRSGSPQIFIMNSDGSKTRRLTFEGKYNTSPSWCPTGNRIVYEGTSNGSFQLFSINEDGSNGIQLTFEKGGCEYPTWSPDGRYIAFSSGGNGKARICVINSNGLHHRVVYENPELDAVYPSWSPHLSHSVP